MYNIFNYINDKNIKESNSKESFINSALIKNKDNYFTKEQLMYYSLEYPFKEFEEMPKFDFNLKK